MHLFFFFCFDIYLSILGQGQADVNSVLLLLGLLCHMLPLMYRLSVEPALINNNVTTSILGLSRVSSICMLVAYAAYLFFQLRTHRQMFESSEEVMFFSIFRIIVSYSEPPIRHPSILLRLFKNTVSVYPILQNSASSKLK